MGVYATLCSPVRSPKFALYRLRSRSSSLHCADAMMIPLLLCPLLPKSDVIGAVGRPFQHEANCHASKQAIFVPQVKCLTKHRKVPSD